MATVLRPPLAFPPQQKRAVYDWQPPRQLALFIAGPNNPPPADILYDSATPRRRQLDNWQQPRNLALLSAVVSATLPPGKQWFESSPAERYLTAGQPLLGFIVDDGPEPLVRQLFDSAPPRKKPQLIEQHLNLLTTTLFVAPPALAFPLNAMRWDASAPQVKEPVYVDWHYRPLTLGINPNAAVAQLFGSSPQREYQVQDFIVPNLLSTTLVVQAPTFDLPQLAVRWDASAPAIEPRPQTDQPPRNIQFDPIPQFARLDQWVPIRKQDVFWTPGPDLQPLYTPTAPLFSGTIPNITERKDTGAHTYDLSVYFIGATSYSINPAVEPGWTFDVNTAQLTIDTDVAALFGPFTVTATNATGSTPSNAFTVEVLEQSSGAGRKTRRRYYVEIDGQQFPVANAVEAVQLLDRARALADRAAETKAKKVEAKAARAQKPRPIRIEPPRITASPELGIDLAPIRADIARIYDSAAAMAELRVLLLRAIEEDEEESILLLM